MYTLCKHEFLCFIPGKKPRVVIITCNAGVREEEAGGPWRMLTILFSLCGVTLKIRWTAPEEQHLRLTSVLHTHSNVHTDEKFCIHTTL